MSRTEWVATELLLRGFELTDEHTREAGRYVENGLVSWIDGLAFDLNRGASLGYWRKELQYNANPCEECMLIARMRQVVQHCTCEVRTVVSSGLIFNHPAGSVHRYVERDPLCEMHGTHKIVDGEVVRR